VSEFDFSNFGLPWQKIGEMMNELRARLGALRLEASGGGGMVTAVADGTGRILQIRFEPQLLEHPDAEMLSDLTAAAVNAVQEKARAAAAEATRQLLPFDLPFDPGQLF
jgi:DNA-binding protein YbaB